MIFLSRKERKGRKEDLELGLSPILESSLMAANVTRLARAQVLGGVVTEPLFKPSELIVPRTRILI